MDNTTAIDMIPMIGSPMDFVRQIGEREKTSSGRFTMRISRQVLFVFALLLFSSTCSADGGCDWTGSGLESERSVGDSGEQRGVKPVYLRCSQGSVSWLYPRGALRVVLRYGTAGKEFQGCLKLSSDFSGANIYVEQHRKLKLLHSTSSLIRPDGKRHCFDSHHGQVALFIESDPSGPGADPLRREAAGFEYDLQLLEHQEDGQSLNDPWQECRPCSVEESLETYCSSDFVARGFITQIYNDANLERTLMTVRATRVIRQASDVFQPLPGSKQERRRSNVSVKRKRRFVPIPSKWRGMDGVEEDLTVNEIDTVEEDEEHTGTLHVPLTCQVKHGSGEFIFMGRKRLGDAIVWCAPRLEEWQEWIEQAKKNGNAQCRLEA